jgi:hypothetical protein
VTHLRKLMLEELQGRKSLCWCLAWLRIRGLDLIAEVSEFRIIFHVRSCFDRLVTAGPRSS